MNLVVLCSGIFTLTSQPRFHWAPWHYNWTVHNATAARVSLQVETIEADSTEMASRFAAVRRMPATASYTYTIQSGYIQQGGWNVHRAGCWIWLDDGVCNGRTCRHTPFERLFDTCFSNDPGEFSDDRVTVYSLHGIGSPACLVITLARRWHAASSTNVRLNTWMRRSIVHVCSAVVEFKPIFEASNQK